MRRERLIFIILSIYIFSAFGWWTYAHYLSNKIIYTQQKELLETICYKATIDIEGARDQELFNDSNDMKFYFHANFPAHEILFLSLYDPMHNFMIRPQFASYQNLQKTYHRKLIMYITEGLVMIALIFWGIIWIYRSFKRELSLKRQQSNFLLSVTHELKTPLTAIKLYLETLLKRKVTASQAEMIIHNSLNDVERLQDSVESLLLSAQLDSKKYELQLLETNLTELLYEAIQKFAHPRNLSARIKTNLEDQVIVKVDPTAIEMILNNLLTNAFKYGTPVTFVYVNLKQDKDITILQVADDGTGINAENKKEIFNKFYRIGDENTRKTKGTGLGLFIVKNLVDLHKADISVIDNQPNGTIFELRFKTHAK
ncbi:MAG: HAMP domain-containing histidine kinase [Bacteroidia bacterium]|nr:HAMP domain-containing histidine kinase [Bacteroidia bacterium]